jgi:hypothetical protein
MYRVGDIGFSTSKSSPFSASIRAFTESNVSHVFIIVGILYGKFLVLEADGNRVDINFLDTYMTSDAYFEIYRLPNSPFRNLALERVVNRYANKTYGRGQIVGFVLDRFLSLFGKGGKNLIDDGIVCSELGMYYTHLNGFRVLPEADPNLVSPAAFRKGVVDLGATFIWAKE